MNRLNLVGVKFGRLTVISSAESRNAKTRWNCICECGTSGVYVTGNLRSGDTTSCGCLPPNRTVHGHNRKGARTRTYSIWAGMVSRCTNSKAKDYKFYGAKGIRVCPQWMEFTTFLADMGEAIGDMTIDRLDSSKDYEPSNCQWLPHADNCRKGAVGRWSATREVWRRMTFQM